MGSAKLPDRSKKSSDVFTGATNTLALLLLTVSAIATTTVISAFSRAVLPLKHSAIR